MYYDRVGLYIGKVAPPYALGILERRVIFASFERNVDFKSFRQFEQ